MTKKDEYKQILLKRKEVLNELMLLKDDEKLKRYLELFSLDESLSKKENELYYDMRMEEFKRCNHVLICSEIKYDYALGKKTKKCACLKCGLDSKVLDCYNPDYLSLSNRVKYDYLMTHKNMLIGKNTNIMCDSDLAYAIYSRIKEINPKIPDYLAIKYFEIALDNIRNIEVSNERKKSRARRLNLQSSFNKWQEKDIYKTYN